MRIVCALLRLLAWAVGLGGFGALFLLCLGYRARILVDMWKGSVLGAVVVASLSLSTVSVPAPRIDRIARVSVSSGSLLQCELSGVRSCGHVLACWSELDDRVCGWSDQAPASAHGFAYGDWLRREFAPHSTSL